MSCCDNLYRLQIGNILLIVIFVSLMFICLYVLNQELVYFEFINVILDCILLFILPENNFGCACYNAKMFSGCKYSSILLWIVYLFYLLFDKIVLNLIIIFQMRWWWKKNLQEVLFSMVVCLDVVTCDFDHIK